MVGIVPGPVRKPGSYCRPHEYHNLSLDGYSPFSIISPYETPVIFATLPILGQSPGKNIPGQVLTLNLEWFEVCICSCIRVVEGNEYGCQLSVTG